jgi:hypothetical protein
LYIEYIKEIICTDKTIKNSLIVGDEFSYSFSGSNDLTDTSHTDSSVGEFVAGESNFNSATK